LPAVVEGAEKSGRNFADIELSIEMKVSFDKDRARAMRDTRHWAALALSGEEKMGIDDPIELERRADVLPVERSASRWIVSDDAEEQVTSIQKYVDLGFTNLIFHAPGPDQGRFLKLYSREVIRLLRERAPRHASS
jgi:coenzyme F420-dependent glucose-6-phosphate dehydrogenase